MAADLRRISFYAMNGCITSTVYYVLIRISMSNRSVFLGLALVFLLGSILQAQNVFRWDEADSPPLFKSHQPVNSAHELDSIGNRQLLERIYAKVRVPHILHSQNARVYVAASILFKQDGAVSIKKIVLIDPKAPNYKEPDDRNLLVLIAYGSSHPDRALMERVRVDTAFRLAREQIINREVLRKVEEVLKALPKFNPALKDGVPVSVSRTLVFEMRSEI